VILSRPVNHRQELDSVSYVGSTIGNIRIESRLGQGGMGEVYLGYDARQGVEMLGRMGFRSEELGRLCREKGL